MPNHVVVVNVDNIVTVITRPDAFTNAQWQDAQARLLSQGFKILLGPGVTFDAVSRRCCPAADAAFFASLPENVTPSTDANPFFFYTARLRGICQHACPTAPADNNAAITMTLMLRSCRYIAVRLRYYIIAPFCPSR